LGAIVAIAVTALHSLPAALVVLVFFVVYQQAENHLLQPVIMSRTVQLSALTVTIAILLGVELLGFLGALLAIPVAGILHVIGRDLYDGYRGQLKTEPTIGQQKVPMSSPDAPDRPDEVPPPTLDTPDRTLRRDQRSTTRSS
jgi:predicted PurR-regulated permease PerM